MSFDRLRRLDRGESQRGDFFVVALVESGHGSVAVDFRTVALAPRSIAWIGPGVVHRWVDIAEIDGQLLLFTPTAPDAASARQLTSTPGDAAVWSAMEFEWALIELAAFHLRQETEAYAGDPASSPDMAGILLSAVILRAFPADQLVAAGNEVFQRFRSAVEKDLRYRHDVAHYARQLGYSPRTLSRTAHRTTGRSAKEYLAERVVLEAKRLLVHDHMSLKSVTDHLGFIDPSAFSAFFRRETGVTPGAWRDSAH